MDKGGAVVLVLVALVVGVCIGGIHPHHKVHKAAVKVEHLKPTCQGSSCKGKLAYKSDDGDWWFYDYAYDGGGSDPGRGSTPPAGGSWARGSAPPKEEIEEEEQMEVNEEADNSPTSESESDAGSSDSGSSDSGSSDSGGGGGDGGGDGGGGD